MKIYLEMVLCEKALEIAGRFAWDNELNITIIYNEFSDDYICVDETESDSNNEFIKPSDFECWDDLHQYMINNVRYY